MFNFIENLCCALSRPVASALPPSIMIGGGSFPTSIFQRLFPNGTASNRNSAGAPARYPARPASGAIRKILGALSVLHPETVTLPKMTRFSFDYGSSSFDAAVFLFHRAARRLYPHKRQSSPDSPDSGMIGRGDQRPPSVSALLFPFHAVCEFVIQIVRVEG